MNDELFLNREISNKEQMNDEIFGPSRPTLSRGGTPPLLRKRGEMFQTTSSFICSLFICSSVPTPLATQ